SDDGSGASVAIAAAHAAAGADREPDAAPAKRTKRKKQPSSSESAREEEKSRVPSEVSGNKEVEKPAKEYFPGEEPLPLDPAEFVEEIHQRTDLFDIWQELLQSDDEKIKQRAVEKLTEMRYKGVQSLADEPQPLLIDIVRPRRPEI